MIILLFLIDFEFLLKIDGTTRIITMTKKIYIINVVAMIMFFISSALVELVSPPNPPCPTNVRARIPHNPVIRIAKNSKGNSNLVDFMFLT
ncbi:MAG: hypothetical protein DRP42_03435 [Tenericutes bacterium]|nr:MAG: hypothetical protein DRP42_03435 [Mycoplasmatota bacterium]